MLDKSQLVAILSDAMSDSSCIVKVQQPDGQSYMPANQENMFQYISTQLDINTSVHIDIHAIDAFLLMSIEISKLFWQPSY